MSEEFWKGEFGDEYLKRNRVDWRARIPFWKMIMGVTGSRSVYEFGCNAGWNLSAIKGINLSFHTGCNHTPEVCGRDLHYVALEQASAAGIRRAYLPDDGWDIAPCELAFTAGVLIHIEPDKLFSAMKHIISKSSDYVLAIEYEAKEEEEVEYRGHSGKLWKRPYGVMYKSMGLTLVDEGEALGFDDCHYWLFRK